MQWTWRQRKGRRALAMASCTLLIAALGIAWRHLGSRVPPSAAQPAPVQVPAAQAGDDADAAGLRSMGRRVRHSDPSGPGDARMGADGALLDPTAFASQEAQDLHVRAWAIVAELERLSLQPDGFHVPALPLIEELEGLVAGLGTRAEASARNLPGELLEQLVQDPARRATVRGAVFLGLATALDDASFRAVFDLWALDRGLPRELLRAAALGASRRGRSAACGGAVELAQLDRFQTDGVLPYPPVYPMNLERVVSEHAARLLLEALLDFDPLLDRIEGSQGMPASPAALHEAGDSIRAREVLICALGPRAAVDAELGRTLLAFADFRQRQDGLPSLGFLAAQLTVHSLVNCGEAFLEFVTRAALSTDPLRAGLYQLMQEHGVGGLHLGQLSQLMSLRGSTDGKLQRELVEQIGSLGERLSQDRDGDRVHRSAYLDFLRQLASDANELEDVRVAAMLGVQRAGDWEVALASATSVLEASAPGPLTAMALTTLVAAGRADGSLRTRIMALLERLERNHPAAWLRSDAGSYLREFHE